MAHDDDDERNVSSLCIQLQPARTKALNVTLVRTLAEALASNETLVDDYYEDSGVDEGSGPYVNLMFETEDLPALWAEIREKLYRHPQAGPGLTQASICVCEGPQGWDDHRLLHHFDPKEHVDPGP